MYKIQDDYHWYQNVSDKDLMEGLSGGPVYATFNNEKFLIGINESLCNIGDGKNPFKIVYFLPIKKVLEWLRSQGILIFEYVSHMVRIKWINNIDSKASKNIILIGSSGSGKSSFAKSFCLHGNEIDASGDGQTTRMTVCYELKTVCEKTQIKITFQNQEEYVTSMMNSIRFNIIDFICRNRFGMRPRNIESDRMVYIKDFLMPIECLNLGQNYTKKIKKVLSKIKNTLYISSCKKDDIHYDDRVLVCYDSIFDLLENILKSGNLKLERLKTLLNKDLFEKYMDQVEENKDESLLVRKYFESVMKGNDQWDKSDNSHLLDELKRLLNINPGYFDLKELYFIDKEGVMKNECEKIFNSLFLKEQGTLKIDWRSLEKFGGKHKMEDKGKKGGTDSIQIPGNENQDRSYELIKKYYKEIYILIVQTLKAKGINIERNKTIFYHFEEMTKKDKEIVRYCLRVVSGNSLTSMVNSIVIEDCFSNEFALLIHSRNIDHITFYDTCGLDHIDRGSEIELYLTTLFNDITANSKVDAVFYIKKMDAGKPAELINTLPIINRLRETVPIYCIFTAADLFFAGKERYLADLRWSKQNYELSSGYREMLFPKAVFSLFEDDTLVKDIKSPKSVKKKIYSVITNNIVPFSCVYQINDDVWLELDRRSINILLTSLLTDEWNSGFIDLKDDKQLSSNEEGIKYAIKKDLKKMFWAASICKWEYKHHMTTEANFRRLFRFKKEYDQKNPTLGFNGVEIGRWDNLLQRGYTEAFLNENSETLEQIKTCGLREEKVYTILAQLKDKMLLSGMSLWDKDEKTNFRAIFEKMYAKGENEKNAYKNNPFNRHEIDVFKEKYDRSVFGGHRQRIDYLNDVCNFEKGLENEDILKEFINYIYKEIDKLIKNENKRCLELLLEYNYEFRDAVNNLICVMENYMDTERLKKDMDILKEKLLNLL